MYDRGDVVLIPFPFSDLTGAKMRPALIISNSAFNVAEDRICCLVTSNPSASGIKIEKQDFEQGKLLFKSTVRPQRLFTINRRIIIKKLCSVKKVFQNKVFESLCKIIE